MATRTEVLQGRLAVDTSAWGSGLAQASSMFKGFSSGIRTGLTGAFSGAFGAIKGIVSGIGDFITSTLSGAIQALGIGGILSAGGIIAGIKNISDLGGEINDISDRTGIAADQLIVLREQFRQGGIEAGAVTQYIRKMNDSLMSPKKANIFEALGLNNKNLLKAGPVEALNSILDKVRELSSSSNKMKTLSEIFGARGGVDLGTLVADDKSEAKAKKMVGTMAKVVADNVNELDRVSENFFGGLPIKLQQAFAGFTTTLLKPLTTLAEWNENADFTPVGQRIGDQLIYLYQLWKQMWQDGTISEYFVKTLITGIIMVGSFASAVFQEAFKAFFSEFNITFAKGILTGLMTWLGGQLQEIVGEILSTMPFMGIRAQVNKDVGRSKQETGLVRVESSLAGLPAGIADSSAKFLEGLKNWDVMSILKPAADSLGEDIKKLHNEAAKKAGLDPRSPFSRNGGIIDSLTPTMQPGTVNPSDSIFVQSKNSEKRRSTNEAKLEQILTKNNELLDGIKSTVEDFSIE